MRVMLLAAAAGAFAAPFAFSGAALADPGDQWKKQWEKRADCDTKLREAKSGRFHKTAADCNRELAKLGREQRKEAAKAWREAEKKWRERQPLYDAPYYDWDD